MFACNFCHSFVYGHTLPSIVETQLLQAHCSKPPCIQWCLLNLQKYNFKLDFVPGKTLVTADVSSCAELVVTPQKFPVWIRMCMSS